MNSLTPPQSAFSTAMTEFLETMVDGYLDIPLSYYTRAVERHHSLEHWLCRDQSLLHQFNPHVSAQGSFRLGTVVRPIKPNADYDLDDVCVLTMTKTSLTQKQLKELYGFEMRAYAAQYSMNTPPQEKPRCWRLRYSDEVHFHLDTLPCVPEDETVIARLLGLGVSPELAQRAVAITDTRHPLYDSITADMYSSNPRGFARWFEQRLRPFAESRIRALAHATSGRRVDDIPPYEWKTALQRTIQLLKRHRDVMFADRADLAPISMIITNLAAHSYQGEQDLWSALTAVVTGMTKYVRPERPRVPNPADPVEDYAEKWHHNQALETNFWNWHQQLRIDLGRLQQALVSGDVQRETGRLFGVQLTRQDATRFGDSTSTPVSAASVAPLVHITKPPRPWSDSAPW